MKALFFDAAASHPSVGYPLMRQVETTLRPFDQYLRQAIHTAQQRQVRYKLPWERVRHQRVLGLNPLDSKLVVPRKPAGLEVANWPTDKPIDTSKPLIVDWGERMVVVLEAQLVDGRLQLVPADPISPDDNVMWLGIDLQLEAAADRAPTEFVDVKGKRFEVKHSEEQEDGWLLLVEGQPADGPVQLGDEEVETQRLPAQAGLTRLFDEQGAVYTTSAGKLKLEENPPSNPLQGDNGIRYQWYVADKKGRKGIWLQLLTSEDDEQDEFLDPRAAFCEDDVKELWTADRAHKGQVIKVKSVDRDSYQLLVEEMPPEGCLLHLPLNVKNLQRQRRAIRQVKEGPLPHHQGLLRLCENPSAVRWPRIWPEHPDRWFVLRDETRDGTDQQRSFVSVALGSLGRDVAPGTGDIALLEGPPGSGKTTAICELVLQLVVERKLRVLLCGTTHYSIDNVLERLVDGEHALDALRIGKVDRVDRKVRDTQLDERVEALVAQWRDTPGLSGHGDAELRAMAERTIIMSADLTCGTTMGILNHPLFQDRDSKLKPWEQPIATLPWWDVLIVDEASRTTIQEFMVPALMAKRWIIVGDIRQLPPFADRADIVANLRSLVDEKDREVFPDDHQRARLLLWHLGRGAVQQRHVRYLIAEPPGVLDHLEAELAAEDRNLDIVRVGRHSGEGASGAGERVTIDQLRHGAPQALRLAAADWVLVPTEILEEVSPWLPSDLLHTRELDLSEKAIWGFRHRHWLDRSPNLQKAVRASRRKDLSTPGELEDHDTEYLSRRDWASEITWRLTRIHELKRSLRKEQRERLQKAIDRLAPATVDVSAAIDEIRDIGLPSILEVIQEGIGEDRSNRPSALTQGIGSGQPQAFEARFGSLRYQHRMHEHISSFPRELFYGGEALMDANTVEQRDQRIGWDFAPELQSRRVWCDVRGREIGNVNQAEVDRMEATLRYFLTWAEKKGAPARDLPSTWEVACICFYVKQERAIRDMLRKVTGQERRHTRFNAGNVEIVSGTVDRFQGREADLVLLSMRNTRRIGFLDSVNRLNVAVTRARQQIIIFGNDSYFERCQIDELEELVKRSRKIDGRHWPQRGRSTRKGR